MVRRRRPPSQGWKTFLRNHTAGTASLDLFVVRTISFKLRYRSLNCEVNSIMLSALRHRDEL
jgi:hypothetical protein